MKVRNMRRVDFEVICRYKRICIKNEMAFSEINDRLRCMYKKRGGHWMSSFLSWYPAA
jgi:hypothetical protein